MSSENISREGREDGINIKRNLLCKDETRIIPRSGSGIVAKKGKPYLLPRSGLRKMDILCCCSLCPTGNNYCI